MLQMTAAPATATGVAIVQIRKRKGSGDQEDESHPQHREYAGRAIEYISKTNRHLSQTQTSWKNLLVSTT